MQPIKVQDVVLRRGNGAKGVKAINRWSTASSIDIEADFEVMANKVIIHLEILQCFLYFAPSGREQVEASPRQTGKC